MDNLFLNQDAATQFQRRGYLLVDFLSDEEANALADLYARYESGVAMDFVASMFSHNAGYRQMVDTAVKAIFAPALAKIFRPHRCLAGTFLEKHPLPAHGEVPLHQDWTFVNETQFSSLNVWCALEDTHEKNGCLWMLPGSHCFPVHPRAPFGPSPWIREFGPDFTSAMCPVPMKKGQAVIFGHAMWHASRLNHTASSRLAASCSLVSQDAELFHYRYIPDAQTQTAWRFERYKVDTSFFSHYQIGSPISEDYPREYVSVAIPAIAQQQRQACLEYIMRAQTPDTGL